MLNLAWIPIVIGATGIIVNGYQIIMIKKYRKDPESFWYGWDSALHLCIGIPFCFIALSIGIIALVSN